MMNWEDFPSSKMVESRSAQTNTREGAAVLCLDLTLTFHLQDRRLQNRTNSAHTLLVMTGYILLAHS